MDLLKAQFYRRRLSLDEIKNILGADFSHWTILKGKFIQDENGQFFNERMDREILKREQNSKQQSEKVKKRWDKYHGINNSNTTVLPNDETETGIDIGKKEKGGPGEKETTGFVDGKIRVGLNYYDGTAFILLSADIRYAQQYKSGKRMHPGVSDQAFEQEFNHQYNISGFNSPDHVIKSINHTFKALDKKQPVGTGTSKVEQAINSNQAAKDQISKEYANS